TTTLIGGKGKKSDIDNRINELMTSIENASSEYDKKKYQERLAKLTGGVAVIKVGAATESELKEKKLRIEDALNATKAAVAEAIVAGGGAVMVEIYQELKHQFTDSNLDVNRGIAAVLDSLLIPTLQIAENAGFDGLEIVEKQKH